MQHLRFLLLICFAAGAGAAVIAAEPDNKKPVGPLKEGMVFEGVFKSGPVNRYGRLTSVSISEFKLEIESVEGELYTGKWTWDGKSVTEVKGKVTKSGQIYLRYTKNLKGSSVASLDGEAAGKVTDKTIAMKFVRVSSNRIGLIEGKIKSDAKDSEEKKKPKNNK